MMPAEQLDKSIRKIWSVFIEKGDNDLFLFFYFYKNSNCDCEVNKKTEKKT